ncbi:MAG TPA: YicC/YloC family endoribonuclease [Burkholderiales bacterium]
MTGYAALSADSPRGRLSLELRSVNSRFLDMQFRIADELRSLEPLLRELILARVARGKLDCRLFFADSSLAQTPQQLNAEALGRLKSLADEAGRQFPGAAPLRLADVLRWPGVVTQSQADEEKMRAAVGELCARALEELVSARAREGEKLGAAIRERIAAMRSQVEAVEPLLPQSIAAYEARLSERLREVLGSGQEERIRAEIAVFAAKVDVDEELTRLRAHFSEIERLLGQGGARGATVGKRLDFLSQELNREANTLAAKAASPAISQCALELKLLTEQIREQAQNIE